MPPKRVTFSEYWYRVADLRPRLVPSVRIHKQFFRGREWYVLRSPVNQEFYRLDEAAYGFIGLLDGGRTVSEAWRLANERFGERAPTQGEAIQLIGQLYVSNLVRADLPPDSAGMFQRYRKRRSREIQSAAMSFLFPKFKLWDPDAFLTRWVGLVGWVFTWKGLALWLALAAAALHALAGQSAALFSSSANVLSPANLPLLYVAFVLAKAVHEAAHGFACKHFGKFERDSGQVHNTGVMLLLFTPAPYVDASTSWAFRSKWRRAMVGAAGVWAEIALAAAAAILWTRTGEGGTPHAFAYNLMFTASVSTLLFNGNPLLRYDAYYILCDLLEIPNLASRGQQYVFYLVKRYAWGVKNAGHAARGTFEKVLFVVYTLAATVYRVFLLAGILLTIADTAFFVGVMLAALSLAMWLLLPLGKFVRYLAVNGELGRTRTRAIGTTAFAALAAFSLVGMIPAPDRFRIEGVVESATHATVHSGAEGFLAAAAENEQPVVAGATVVARLDNPALRNKRRVLAGKEKELLAELRRAEATDASEALATRKSLDALREEMRRVDKLIEKLRVTAVRDGVWVAPRLDNQLGKFVRHGESLGEVIDPGRLLVRSFPGQNAAVELISQAAPRVELRVKGRPDLESSARIVGLVRSGSKKLPSPALGSRAGGETPIDPGDPKGATSEEHVFEIKLEIEPRDWRLLPGQVVVMRFAVADKPLAAQWWRELLQLLQRRFHV